MNQYYSLITTLLFLKIKAQFTKFVLFLEFSNVSIGQSTMNTYDLFPLVQKYAKLFRFRKSMFAKLNVL